MPLPAPVLYPPFNIVRLSHVEYRVTDLAASRAFYVDILGLQVTDEDDTTVYLRAMEERGHHCIALVQADAARVGVLGFKLFDEPDLDKAAAWFAGQGLPVEWVERPYQARTLRTRDPFGIPLEFYVKMDRLSPIISNISSITGSNRCGSTISTCSAPMWMPRSNSTTTSGSG